MSVQPDLFGEYDAEQARREADMQPHTCPACGTVEPNRFLLDNNHWPSMLRDGMCTAQQLTRNHIWHAAVHDPNRLPEYLARGRALGLDVVAILAEVTP